jgi:AraC-like DNA-binding protein
MTHVITQDEAVASQPLAAGERARFFVPQSFPRLDCLTATFRTHVYADHAHETYTIGIIDAGCETWHARGARHYAGPGDVVFNNPLDVHDGAPHGEGYDYRMTYPTIELMREIASAVSGRSVTATPMFEISVVHDPQGAQLFAQAHAALDAGTDALAGEELLLRAYGRLLARHASVAPLPLGRESGPVGRVRAAIEERYDEALRLNELAAIAGLSTHHLVRVFRAETGLTPHAYVVDVRVRRARELLRAGIGPAAAAGLVGVADQAHLTRAFKARLGVGPGAYRRALGAEPAR